MPKAKVTNCKEASIRRNPAAAPCAEDIVGVISAGEIIQVNTSKRVFSWDDREYYECQTSVGDGYILTDLVRIMGRRRKTNGR